tara:strand:- start:3671 stop:3892 length:222 start_codon:yes stop_codon:yes gene_type:complete
MGSFSIWHWLVVLVIVVIVFGTKKLRNIGGDVGGAVKEFKDGMKDKDEEDTSSLKVSGKTAEDEAKDKTQTKL